MTTNTIDNSADPLGGTLEGLLDETGEREEAYGEALKEGTTMVLSPDSDFFRFFGSNKK